MNFIDTDKIHVVWLDLDDTLIDFKSNSRAALIKLWERYKFDRLWPEAEKWIEAYERHNIPLWVDYSVGLIPASMLRTERFRRPLTEAGMPEDEALVLCPELDPGYLDILAGETRLVPGARELLEWLRRHGLIIGILSNGFADVQYRKLENTGLAPLVDLVVLSDDIGINKPDTRLFRHAQSRTPWPDTPEAHLMIGDNPATDIGGALAAGWSAVWLNRRGADPHEVSAPTISDLSELFLS